MCSYTHTLMSEVVKVYVKLEYHIEIWMIDKLKKNQYKAKITFITVKSIIQ